MALRLTALALGLLGVVGIRQRAERLGAGLS
jgi:hypothetical protein